MAPKVCVPADFGKRHIGAPSHGNLTFNMKEGEPIKANSIILSLNSPVIDNLTTDLHLTSLDVEDFSREAVDCFIEACYTGEVEAGNLRNFRDVNKMSHVFGISWLSARCEKYFVSYLDNLTNNSCYPDILFAAEEAVYFMSALKKRDFLDLVVKKMSTTLVLQRENFLNQFLSDIALSTKFQIDACVEIAQDDVHVLVQVLLAHLKNQNANHLDQNSRYLLQHIDLNLCYWKKPETHEGLFHYFENMESVQTEDFKLFVSLYKQKCSLRQNFYPIFSNDFGKYLDLDFKTALDELSADHNVGSLYSFFDGIWLKLMNSSEDDFDDDILNNIIALKDERGWCKMEENYLNNYCNSHNENSPSIKFLQLVKNCEYLVSKSDDLTFKTIHEYRGSQFLQEVIFKDNAFMFKLPNSKYTGKQFVLSIIAMKDDNSDSFSMRLSALDTILGRQHEQLPKLHLVLSISKSRVGKSTIFPLSWSGKPTYNKEKTLLEWGYFWSPEIKEGSELTEKDRQSQWTISKNFSEEASYSILCFEIA